MSTPVIRTISHDKTRYSLENEAGDFSRSPSNKVKAQHRSPSQKRAARQNLVGNQAVVHPENEAVQQITTDSSKAHDTRRRQKGRDAHFRRSDHRPASNSSQYNENDSALMAVAWNSNRPTSLLASSAITASSSSIRNNRETLSQSVIFLEHTDLPQTWPAAPRSPSQKRQGRQRHSREVSKDLGCLSQPSKQVQAYRGHHCDIDHALPTPNTLSISVRDDINYSNDVNETVQNALQHTTACGERSSTTLLCAMDCLTSTTDQNSVPLDASTTTQKSDYSVDSQPTLPLPAKPSQSTHSLMSVVDTMDAILQELMKLRNETIQTVFTPSVQPVVPNISKSPNDTLIIDDIQFDKMRTMIHPLVGGVSSNGVDKIILDARNRNDITSADVETPSVLAVAPTNNADKSTSTQEEVPPIRYSDCLLRVMNTSSSSAKLLHKRRHRLVVKAVPSLMGASARGAGWMVSLLLQCGADVNTRHGHNGTTALHKAAYWGHRETVLLLLEAGANPLATDRVGRTPVAMAAFGGKTKSALIIRDILDHLPIEHWKAAINTIDSYGRTATHYAIENGNFGVLHLLLHYGADLKQASAKKSVLDACFGSQQVRCIQLAINSASGSHLIEEIIYRLRPEF